MASLVDFVYLIAAFVVPSAYQSFVALPRLKAKLAAGVPGTRVKSLQGTVGLQWVLTLPVLLIWQVFGRSWSALGVTLPARDWHLYAAVALVVCIAIFGMVQVRGINRIAASPEKRDEHRKRLARGGLSPMLPRTDREYRWMTVASCTAGICEELLWRGYLMWVLAGYFRLPVAIAINSVLFGAAHSYQGRKGVARTAAIPVAMNLVVWLSGSLLPAMLLHALGDATTARYGYVACGDDVKG